MHSPLVASVVTEILCFISPHWRQDPPIDYDYIKSYVIVNIGISGFVVSIPNGKIEFIELQ